MIKPEEEEIIAILNLKKSSNSWCVFNAWLDKCLAKSRSRLVDAEDINTILRDQGYTRAFKFIVEQLDAARKNYDEIRKNTA